MEGGSSLCREEEGELDLIFLILWGGSVWRVCVCVCDMGVGGAQKGQKE